MAFKKMTDFDEERYGGFFLLKNDGDYADVIFLYQSKEDVLIADAHYVKSANYTGYVHCLGNNCPVCNRDIRIQTKLFIPVYNINTKQIEFWDRNVTFENQLVRDVFAKCPNPSEFVFRIVRKGAYRDVNTVYEIRPMYVNNLMSYHEILASQKVSMPDHYNTVCRDVSYAELSEWLSSSNTSNSTTSNIGTPSSLPNYVLGERRSSAPNFVPDPVVVTSTTVVDDIDNMPNPEMDELTNPVDF